jgi:Flp pilus assembly protein TadB
MTVALIAFALAGDAPLAVVAIVGLAVVRPVWFLAAAGVWGVVAHRRERRSRPTADDEADALRGLVAELAAGASLRMAVDAAAARAPRLGLDRAARRARAGLPLARVADAMAIALPVNGRSVRAAMAMAGSTGAPAAPVFAALADRAAEVGRLRRDRRALTAQARLSAVVVGGIPALLAVVFVLSGRAATLWADPAGRTVLVVGGLLVASGSALVGWMVRDR